MNRNRIIYLGIFFPCLIMVLYCEYIHYYIVLNDCYWPDLNREYEDLTIDKNNEEPLRILVVTDIHLVSYRHGFWIERKLREWQMYRAYRTALGLLQPDFVFVLGDILEDGKNLSFEDFEEQVRKFYEIFAVPEGIGLHAIVGNHDIGFHYEIRRKQHEYFVSAFKSPDVEMITLKGNHFVLINSMAMEGDACSLCKPVMQKLSEIGKILKCSKGTFEGACDDIDSNSTLPLYSKPVLMQHFPLYRPSDMDCHDFDQAHFPIKQEKFKEAWDCLSKNSTTSLLSLIEPRLSLSGHTHHGCTRKLPSGHGIEITIPSINWRLKNNPSIGLGVFTPSNYAFIKCPIPRQSTAIIIYTTGICLILLWLLYKRFWIRRRYILASYI